MGKLSTFRNIVKAFELIDRDNLGVMAPGVKIDAEVPRELEESFGRLEAELAKLEGKKVRDVVRPERIAENEGTYEMIDGTDEDEALYFLANPVDDMSDHILEGLGTDPMNKVVVQSLLNEYFDGQLGEMFRKPIRPPRRR